MRPTYDVTGGSATPIYDALCAEYRRLFRALPGDRSGEEELRFDPFGPVDPVDAFTALGTERRRYPALERPALPPAPGDGGTRDAAPDGGRGRHGYGGADGRRDQGGPSRHLRYGG